MNAPIIGGLSCKNCAHRRADANAMVCTLNPPTAVPLMVTDKHGMPQVHGWASSFPPVNPGLKCGQHKYHAMYDERTDPPPMIGQHGVIAR